MISSVSSLMRSKIFRRRHRFDRGCGCGGAASKSLQAKAVVPTKFTTTRGLTLLSYGFSLALLRFSAAVNESLSYGAICFPDDTVCFFILKAEKGRRAFTPSYSSRWRSESACKM